ncbi:chorismate mutase family protein [Aquabacterium sp. A7-Y]|uniref:chorismate mutase family protein n=1 Tax=Aquabacterium sp. A7-Y TaxID=1349605 RepID=UPI00223E6A58|nr:chorismate mutase family protein [Aquabacterium sp. A7-Y]MCW7537012.1 chorismate mutase family protein [Aquabacterium sp. A7-Y]
MPTNSTTDEVLEKLRAELDRIDEEFLEVLCRRIECCSRIGHHKREHDVPMMQPHRIGLVHRRAEEFAIKHGLNSKFLRNLYDLIIEETCRLETLIIGKG